MEDTGVVLIGPAGLVVAANQKARAILAEGDGLVLIDDRLATSAGLQPEDGMTRVDRPSGQAPYVLWVTALENGTAANRYRAVTIYGAAPRQPLNLSLLRAAYSLTRAEMALAEQVVLGKQPREAALVLGVTIHTVRTYLKRLYNKTGARTQAKLMRVLLEVVRNMPDGAR